MALSKRSFLKLSLFGAGVAGAVSLFFLPSAKERLEILLSDLFPDRSCGVGTSGANARAYMAYILNHSRISDDEKDFIRNGLGWLDTSAKELFSKEYEALDASQRQAVLEHIASQEWGESFIQTLLGYIFEAQFGDPIYGINFNEAGWKWLAHTPGYPRPQKAFDG